MGAFLQGLVDSRPSRCDTEDSWVQRGLYCSSVASEEVKSTEKTIRNLLIDTWSSTTSPVDSQRFGCKKSTMTAVNKKEAGHQFFSWKE